MAYDPDAEGVQPGGGEPGGEMAAVTACLAASLATLLAVAVAVRQSTSREYCMIKNY